MWDLPPLILPAQWEISSLSTFKREEDVIHRPSVIHPVPMGAPPMESVIWMLAFAPVMSIIPDWIVVRNRL